MISQRELYGLARDVERAADLVQKDRPNTARELLLSVTERLWDAAFEPQSLTPMVGAEGGAGCSAVNQTEPGPVVGGSPARASLDGRKARLAEALDPDGEGLFTDDPRGQT